MLGTTVGVLRVEVLGKRVRGRGLERWVDVLERKGWSVSVRGLKCFWVKIYVVHYVTILHPGAHLRCIQLIREALAVFKDIQYRHDRRG